MALGMPKVITPSPKVQCDVLSLSTHEGQDSIDLHAGLKGLFVYAKKDIIDSNTGIISKMHDRLPRKTFSFPASSFLIATFVPFKGGYQSQSCNRG